MADKYYIGSAIKTPAPHHESFKALWETKWKKACEMGIYPFMFGTIKDFQPVVDELTRKDMKEPYDWDAYASTFSPYAEALVEKATEAEKAGEKEKASELYLRASAIYRISRFPIPRSPKQKQAWEKGKEACIKGLGLREHPVHEILVPHTYGIEGEGSHIPIYHAVPPKASKIHPAATLIIFTGLDGYRTELAVWIKGFIALGVAVIVVEIPGTGDSPALPSDPKGADRQWSSLLDWIDQQEALDSKKVAVWGFSTGGYSAIRIAHTHAERLAGVVCLGGGCHHMFDPEWTDEVNHLEYPFDLAGSLAHKFGYGNDITTYKKEASEKFSLLKDGTLDKPGCARLLLINGLGDEIFPIDDMYIALQHGSTKEARFIPATKHMGEPASFFIILPWLYKLLGVQGNAGEQMSTIPFKAKY
ncbi:MAG: hypothetical protein M1834_001112 [Cirrosporium novae-zelandiae]|nr:MAG: hypothetical protein M1834_001112 [Cirrosporium novae-zelandiae]